jgi:hypothetical protein
MDGDAALVSDGNHTTEKRGQTQKVVLGSSLAKIVLLSGVGLGVQFQ